MRVTEKELKYYQNYREPPFMPRLELLIELLLGVSVYDKNSFEGSPILSYPIPALIGQDTERLKRTIDELSKLYKIELRSSGFALEHLTITQLDLLIRELFEKEHGQYLDIRRKLTRKNGAPPTLRKKRKKTK